MSKKLIWIDETSCLGALKNCVKAGDVIDQSKYSKELIDQLIMENKIGYEQAAPVGGSDRELIGLKNIVAELKTNLAAALNTSKGDCISCKKKDEIIETLKDEIQVLNDSFGSDDEPIEPADPKKKDGKK